MKKNKKLNNEKNTNLSIKMQSLEKNRQFYRINGKIYKKLKHFYKKHVFCKETHFAERKSLNKDKTLHRRNNFVRKQKV